MTRCDGRLEEVNRIRVIDAILAASEGVDWDFDRFTRLAGATLNAPVCLVSLVTSDCQVFAGACGLPPQLDALRKTPLTHSICQHAVTRRSMLVIGDTLRDPLVSEILSVRDFGIRAYLGCPIMTHDGDVLGSFCAIDYVPREWTSLEIDQIRDFAALVVQKIEGKMSHERNRSAFDVVIHDLKSPLSGILMASALLAEQSADFPERANPLLEAIGEEGGKALRLVEFLASENRNETVGLCNDPRDVISTVIDRMKSFADAKSIGIEADLADCAPWITGPWVVEQVVENLLSNAIKYSPWGSSVRISTGISGRIAHLTIADEGPGFTEEDRKKIFRRYMRLSASPTGNETSTGLGLSIVKRLVDQHGGRIELLPDSGGGAEFRITFGLAVEPASASGGRSI